MFGSTGRRIDFDMKWERHTCTTQTMIFLGGIMEFNDFIHKVRTNIEFCEIFLTREILLVAKQ